MMGFQSWKSSPLRAITRHSKASAGWPSSIQLSWCLAVSLPCRIELDRYRSKIHPDDFLLRRLARLRSKDQTWCLLSAPAQTVTFLTRGHEMYDVLAKLSPELAEFARSGYKLEFGIHYGRRVEFEYELSFTSDRASRETTGSQKKSPDETIRSSSLLPALDTTGDTNARHGLIAVSTSRYNRWLAEISRSKFPAD